jgi:AcrR family transcriptional regulator
MKIRTNLNSRTVPTRIAIGNAILDELEKKEFTSIKVTDVIKIAGVSRMSFYRYYENLYDALCDYLDIIVNGYMIEGGEVNDPGVFMRPEHIEFSLNYFDRYARYFLILNRTGLYTILIDAVNEYMIKNILPQKKLHMYELYAYAGGLLNSFLKWEEDGKRESAHNVALMIYRLFSHPDSVSAEDEPDSSEK